jgi:hypothetical protein
MEAKMTKPTRFAISFETDESHLGAVMAAIDEGLIANLSVGRLLRSARIKSSLPTDPSTTGQIVAILAARPSTAVEIQQTTGRTASAIYAGLSKLVKLKQVKKLADKTYRLLPRRNGGTK